MKDVAVKECAEIIARNRSALQDISKTLDHAIALAQKDFLVVQSLFKICYESRDITLKDEVTASGIAEDLQYIDILRQKIEHVLSLHIQIEDTDDFKLLSGAIFKLNYFQIKLADFDFWLAVARIRTKMTLLQKQMTSVPGVSVTTDYLSEASDVSAALDHACKILHEITLQYKSFEANDLLSQAVSLGYSMDSERFVLKWFVERAGSVSYQELLADYKNMKKSMSVEIF